MSIPGAATDPDPCDLSTLTTGESWWRDHYTWLDGRGYNLGPRYKPNWKPSWLGTEKDPEDCEDGQVPSDCSVLGAVRKSDGASVSLKQVRKSEHPEQVSISQYLSSKPLADDPRNHCCPLYEVLQVPNNDDLALLVMPLLYDSDDVPFFTTVGEMMECLRQIVEGFHFMHSQDIAYGQISSFNVMFDPQEAHSASNHLTTADDGRDLSEQAGRLIRPERPIKYYLSDFRDSHRYARDDGSALDKALSDGAGSAPKCWKKKPQGLRDPFLVDVYFLGRMIMTEVIQTYNNCGFLKPLAESMVIMDPVARATMDQVAERLDEILKTLSNEERCSRLVILPSSSEMLPGWLDV